MVGCTASPTTPRLLLVICVGISQPARDRSQKMRWCVAGCQTACAPCMEFESSTRCGTAVVQQSTAATVETSTRNSYPHSLAEMPAAKLRKRIAELEAQVAALQATVDAQHQALARKDARIAALRSSQRTRPTPLSVQAAGLLAFYCLRCQANQCHSIIGSTGVPFSSTPHAVSFGEAARVSSDFVLVFS